MKFWGIHNDTLTTELLDEGFVSIGWDELGDLNRIAGGREGLKSALDLERPGRKPGAIAGWAGVLIRFRDEIEVGDVVVAPYKPDSTINIGVVTGDYYYAAEASMKSERS
jgi:restriction system protein